MYLARPTEDLEIDSILVPSHRPDRRDIAGDYGRRQRNLQAWPGKLSFSQLHACTHACQDGIYYKLARVLPNNDDGASAYIAG